MYLTFVEPAVRLAQGLSEEFCIYHQLEIILKIYVLKAQKEKFKMQYLNNPQIFGTLIMINKGI